MKALIWVFGLALAGCWSADPSALGVDEPLQVAGATFHPGELPGSPPVHAGEHSAKPTITTVQTADIVFHAGGAGYDISGNVTDDAVGIAVAFSDLGTGYWVVPTGSPDPAQPGTLGWSLSLAMGRNATAGYHPLRFVGVDDKGHAGTQNQLEVCVASLVPDGLNACDPTLPPPFAVVSLDWDADADLDLVVKTPSGKIVDPKHPSTATPDADGGLSPDPAKDGFIDHDSDARCVMDGLRRENLVWPVKPDPGIYLVSVDMFAACGQDAAHYTTSLWLSQKQDGHDALVQVQSASGILLAADANAGKGSPLFTMQFQIE